MQERQLTGTFKQTAEFQEKYKSLLSVCDSNGTMVSQDRLLERDADIAPYRFFRKGTREYVFPKQTVSLKLDKSHVIDNNPNYRLNTEEQEFSFDEGKVEGTLRIEYKDSENMPCLIVNEKSEIPEPVRKTLDSIFSR